MKILVTGCAGFIGYHLCKKLTHNSKYNSISLRALILQEPEGSYFLGFKENE